MKQRMRLAIAVAGLVASGCPEVRAHSENPPGSANRKSRQTTRPGKGARMTAKPAVEVKLVGLRAGRPPQLRLQFDVTFRNERAAPRWFLVPNDLPVADRNGGVAALEVYALSGKGRAIVGRFLGSGGFQAVLVPGRAEVTVRQLPLNWWAGPPDAPIPFDVVIARALTIGDKPARAWFDGDPTSDAGADVSPDQTKMIGSRKTPGGKEVKVATVEDRRVTVTFDLRPSRQ